MVFSQDAILNLAYSSRLLLVIRTAEAERRRRMGSNPASSSGGPGPGTIILTEFRGIPPDKSQNITSN